MTTKEQKLEELLAEIGSLNPDRSALSRTLTRTEAARRLSVSVALVERMIAACEILELDVGGIPASEIERLIRGGKRDE